MPRKTLDSLSEPMFYVLMALQKQPLCGADIAQWVSARTEKRIVLGPGTLYTILGKLTGEQLMEARDRRSTIAIELAKLEEEAHHHHDHDDDDDECDDPDCICHHHHHDDDDED